jgi:ADP-dependent NAD(P)H-hydrate dehydratase
VAPAEPRAVTPALLKQWPLEEPQDGGGKHERGTVLVVGGADSTPGAVLLAGLGALRSGAGRLQVATVSATAVALGVTMPEAMVVGLPAAPDGSLAPSSAAELAGLAERAQAVVIGPGLLDADATAELLAGLLPRLTGEARVVLDAVALYALAGRPDLVDPVRGRAVLTPNGGEASALLDDGDAEGVEAARRIADRYGVAVATQGGAADPDGRVWSDESGGIGLGTSGSGDVLAGVVGGLLARGAEPAQAAVFGQYAHAAAGDRLTARVGRLGFLARELLDELPPVLDGVRP